MTEAKTPAATSTTPSLPSNAPLEQLIHDPSSEVLCVVAADARLTEDLALSLLKRRDLPSQALESLYKQRSLSKLRKVQLAIVMHPHTPWHVSIPIIRRLYAFELMQVALTPSVAPDIKRAAEEAVVAKLNTVSAGERMELAKRGSGRVAAELLVDKDQRILQAALRNPQMTEVWIVKALKTASGTELLAPAVCRHDKWSQRTEVKVALVSNWHTPLESVTAFSRELPARVLREILSSGRLRPTVKVYLSHLLESRSQR